MKESPGFPAFLMCTPECMLVWLGLGVERAALGEKPGLERCQTHSPTAVLEDDGM